MIVAANRPVNLPIPPQGHCSIIDRPETCGEFAGYRQTVGPTKMIPPVIAGNLLDQKVEVIVNAWNRNIIPWWLLIPQGVSGAIKRRGGLEPFKELGRLGPIPLGGAVLTGPGRLPFRGMIHVAGINLLWRASRRSIGDSVRSAMRLVAKHGFRSVAFPIIGAGSGGFGVDGALKVMQEAFSEIESGADTFIVRFEVAA
jgi:O-acetyl-ADP-ribose deacetylase (regulator of RNase III)